MTTPGRRSVSVRPRSLAARITFFTFTSIMSFALIASVLALYGVSSMARQESAARITAYRQILSDAVTQRLATADRAVDGLALASKVASRSPEQIAADLDRLAGDNGEIFDEMAIVRMDGRVLAQVPGGSVPPNVGQLPYFAAVSDPSLTEFRWQPASGKNKAHAWMLHAVRGTAGDAYVLMARLHTEFLQQLADATASSRDSRVALAISPAGQVVARGGGGPSVEVSKVAFSSPIAETGDATVSQAKLGMMSGLFRRVSIAGDPVLRLVILEPESLAFERSGGALIPAGIAIFLGALAFAAMASVFARRLTAPVRDLEARAREVSTGAYVRPLVVDRDDEIGLMSGAFNTMANRINMLQDVSQLLASASEIDHVLDGIISATAHLLRTGSIAIFLLDERRTALHLARASGLRMDAAGLSVPLRASSVIAEAFRADRPLTFVADPETAKGDPALGVFGVGQPRSGVAMPLVSGRDTLGVVVVVSPGVREFTDADLEMIKTFSAQAAVAVRNSRLFHEEHVSRREAEALREVAEVLVSSTDPDPALDEVAEAASALLEVGTVEFAFHDRGSLGLGTAADPEREAERLAMADECAERLGTEPGVRGSVVFDDALRDPVSREYAVEHDISGLILVALYAGGGLCGVMTIEAYADTEGFLPRQVALATAIGNEVSLALESQYLLTKTRARAASLERIFRISQAVSSSLQVKTVLNRVLDIVQKIFSADAVSLMRFDATKRVLETTMARGIQSKDLLFFTCGPTDDIPGAVYQSKAPLRLDSFEARSTPFVELAREHGFRSILAVPLIARGRAVGVLSVFSEGLASFSDEDMELLATFASQAALATDTAELFSKEHTIATVLKSSILPDSLVEVPGLETYSLYRPAGGESEIGGDYYDMFVRTDGKVVLSIADVCGQGVRAATKTSMIRYTVRGMAAAGMAPAAMASELNRVVFDTGDTSDIVTAFIALLDMKTLTLTYANAGHPPALLLRGEGLEALETTGPLLGAISGVEFQERTVALEPCDLLVMYTDGVTEARRQRELYGEERLRRVVARGGTPSEVTQALLADVQGFSGDLRDDIAVLTVRISEEGTCG